MTILLIISILIAFILGALVFWAGMKYQDYNRDKLWNEYYNEIERYEAEKDPEDPKKKVPVIDIKWDDGA